jgi:anti-anti-sigma factor
MSSDVPQFAAPGELILETHTRDRAVVVALHGELDIATAPLLREALDAIEDGRPEELTIDLRGLTFIDSAGLHLIATEHSRLARAGRTWLALRPGPGPVQRLFELTQLDEVLPFVD